MSQTRPTTELSKQLDLKTTLSRKSEFQTVKKDPFKKASLPIEKLIQP